MIQVQRRKFKNKNPTNVFNFCPACDSPNVFKFEGEVFCEYCDWNSIEVNFEARLSANAYEAMVLGETIVSDSKPSKIEVA